MAGEGGRIVALLRPFSGFARSSFWWVVFKLKCVGKKKAFRMVTVSARNLEL